MQGTFEMAKLARTDTEIRYDTSAIQFMDRERDRLYDLWLGLATQHALEAQRHRVLAADLRATIDDAVKKLLETVPPADETASD